MMKEVKVSLRQAEEINKIYWDMDFQFQLVWVDGFIFYRWIDEQ